MRLAGLNVPSSHVAVSGFRRILLRSLSTENGAMVRVKAKEEEREEGT